MTPPAIAAVPVKMHEDPLWKFIGNNYCSGIFLKLSTVFLAVVHVFFSRRKSSPPSRPSPHTFKILLKCVKKLRSWSQCLESVKIRSAVRTTVKIRSLPIRRLPIRGFLIFDGYVSFPMNSWCIFAVFICLSMYLCFSHWIYSFSDGALRVFAALDSNHCCFSWNPDWAGPGARRFAASLRLNVQRSGRGCSVVRALAVPSTS